MIDPEEWTPGEKQTVAVNAYKPELLQWDAVSGEKASLPSRAWLQVDDDALYVAFDNAIDPDKGVAGGRQWGRSDAVEVALAVVTGDEPGPILLWRGYTDGHVETSSEAGAPKAALDRAIAGVQYGAKVVAKDRWTAELRIPFASLNIAPREHNPRILFSLSVRKVRGDLWVTLEEGPWPELGRQPKRHALAGALWPTFLSADAFLRAAISSSTGPRGRNRCS